MTGLGVLRVSALLFVLVYSSSALDLDLEESYSILQNVDLQEPFPNATCAVDKGCVMHDNVIQIIPEVFTLEECRERCEKESRCAFLTYFGADNFPFVYTCVMLESCDDIAPCIDCRTEDMVTAECIPCSGRVHGTMGTNFINFIPNKNEELDCKGECEKNGNCAWYTYYDKDDPTYPGGCFLLSDVQEPIQNCDNCQTGPMDCSQRCTLSVDGGEFKNTADPIKGDMIVKTRTFGHCELTVVAVGGGAQGFTGGGGSGYVQYENISGAGMEEFNVTVGESDEDTLVWLLSNDSLFLQAESGKLSSGEKNENGGDGYSGGGATVFMSKDGGGDGGTGGGDGRDSSNGNKGGHGSATKLVDIPISDRFQLSAGAGGKHAKSVGGGGGGVLIDGDGPIPQYDDRNGEGYGAGGYGNGRKGTAGVVLFSYHNKHTKTDRN